MYILARIFSENASHGTAIQRISLQIKIRGDPFAKSKDLFEGCSLGIRHDISHDSRIAAGLSPVLVHPNLKIMDLIMAIQYIIKSVTKVHIGKVRKPD